MLWKSEIIQQYYRSIYKCGVYTNTRMTHNVFVFAEYQKDTDSNSEIPSDVKRKLFPIELPKLKLGLKFLLETFISALV